MAPDRSGRCGRLSTAPSRRARGDQRGIRGCSRTHGHPRVSPRARPASDHNRCGRPAPSEGRRADAQCGGDLRRGSNPSPRAARTHTTPRSRNRRLWAAISRKTRRGYGAGQPTGSALGGSTPPPTYHDDPDRRGPARPLRQATAGQRHRFDPAGAAWWGRSIRGAGRPSRTAAGVPARAGAADESLTITPGDVGGLMFAGLIRLRRATTALSLKPTGVWSRQPPLVVAARAGRYRQSVPTTGAPVSRDKSGLRVQIEAFDRGGRTRRDIRSSTVVLSRTGCDL